MFKFLIFKQNADKTSLEKTLFIKKSRTSFSKKYYKFIIHKPS